MNTRPVTSDLPSARLLPFLILAFGICWGILALYLFTPAPMERLFGPLTGQHPLFYLATYAPALAALLLVTRHAGLPGLRRFLSRLTLLRIPAPWWIFLLAGIPAIFYTGSLLKGNLGHTPLFPFDSPAAFLTASFLMAVKGPVEEIGWRGLALPLLQRRLPPIASALILGVLWGLWHLPAFLLGGTPQSAWQLGPFFLGTVALSVIVTPLFNQSRGSILIPALFHFILINPLWPDAQPCDTPLFILAALLITLLLRKQMFSRHHAVTEVIPS